MNTFFLLLQQAHLDTQSRAREEMGIELTDFDETRTPFQLQILARVQALEISDIWVHDTHGDTNTHYFVVVGSFLRPQNLPAIFVYIFCHCCSRMHTGAQVFEH